MSNKPAYTVAYRPDLSQEYPWTVFLFNTPITGYNTKERAELIAAASNARKDFPQRLAALGYRIATKFDIFDSTQKSEAWEIASLEDLPDYLRLLAETEISNRNKVSDSHNWLYLWRKVS